MTAPRIQNLQDVERELDRRRLEDPLALVYKPHEKQIELHRSRRPICLALGANRCQPAETLIRHADGRVRTLATVSVGDQLLGVRQGAKRRDVRTATVLQRCDFDDEALRVTTKRGYTFEGTFDHPVWACPPSEPGWHGGRVPDAKRAQWTQLKDLQTGWYAELVFGNERPAVDETAYFHGLMEGDGGMYGDYGVMKFFAHDEESLAAWVEAYLDRLDVSHRQFRGSEHGISIEWCNLDFKRQYQSWSPQWTLAEIAGFIRGVADAEGCVSSHSVIIVGTDLELGQRLQQWLMLFGVRASCRMLPAQPQWRRPSPSFRLEISGFSVRRFAEAIGFAEAGKALKLATIVAARRQGSTATLRWERVVQVEPCGRRHMVGIQTDTQTYVGQGVNSHNSGKSWGMVADSQYYALGRAIWAEVPEPPIQVWYIMPSLPMFRRSIKPIFNRLSPQKEIKRIYWRDGIVSYKNGTELHFLSADMRQRRLQGASVHVAYVDETPDEEVFEEVQARVLDTQGRIILGFAPIDVATAWVKDKIYMPYLSGERHDIDVINMPVADRAGHSLVPWFTDDDVARMEQQWPDPAVRAARMYGEFISRAGLVFKAYAADTHLINPFVVPEEYARWLIIDPQYHRFAALYFAADERGMYYLTDEYFSQDETLAARAERLASIIGKRDRPIPAYVDSANPQDTAELNWHFQRLGASIGAVALPMTKHVDDMVLRVHSLMEPDDERLYPKITELGELYGAPRLLIFNTLCSTWKYREKDMVCSRLLWELQRLSWKHGKPDKETADGADASDCLIYGCSIMQSGSAPVELEAWKKDLSDLDLLTWRLIGEADQRDLSVRED